MQQGRGVDEFDGRGDIDDVLYAVAAKSEVGEKRNHRPDSFAAPLDQMRGNIREIPFSRADCAKKILFDELELLGNAVEGIVSPVKQRNSPVFIQRAGQSCL